MQERRQSASRVPGGPAPVTRQPVPVSGPCEAGSHSSCPRRFPPSCQKRATALRRRRHGSLRLVHRLHRSYRRVRRLSFVHHRLWLQRPPRCGPSAVAERPDERSPGCRANSVVAGLGSMTTRDRRWGSPWRPAPYCLPPSPTGSASRRLLSRLEPQPALPLTRFTQALADIGARSAADPVG